MMTDCVTARTLSDTTLTYPRLGNRVVKGETQQPKEEEVNTKESILFNNTCVGSFNYLFVE